MDSVLWSCLHGKFTIREILHSSKLQVERARFAQMGYLVYPKCYIQAAMVLLVYKVTLWISTECLGVLPPGLLSLPGRHSLCKIKAQFCQEQIQQAVFLETRLWDRLQSQYAKGHWWYSMLAWVPYRYLTVIEEVQQLRRLLMEKTVRGTHYRLWNWTIEGRVTLSLNM